MHGVAIRTTAGFQRVGAIRTARRVHTLTTPGSAGSVSIPAFSAARGFIFSPGLVMSDWFWSWTEATKTFAWTTTLTVQVDFYMRSS